MTIRAEQEITLTRVDDGEQGSDGTTFTPSVDSSGNISWTNDGGKENPETRNIKGPEGDDGVSITKAEYLYWIDDTNTVPAKPASKVTENRDVHEAWTLAEPTSSSVYKYYFTCIQQWFSNGSFGWTDPIKNETLNDAATAKTAAQTAAADAQAARQDADSASESASAAQASASAAQTSAGNAETSASTAASAATSAQGSASAAATSASNAESSASAAQTSASNAATSATAAQQSASTAASAATSAQGSAASAAADAASAGRSASVAEEASNAAIEANYRKYNSVSWDATTIATKTAHGYSESWARSSAEGYYQGACNVGDVLLIYVTNTSVSPNTVHKLLVRVTAASVAGAATTGEVISYSSNINAYFWHDENGAHILSSNNGYRTDLSGNGMEIVNISTGHTVANFDDNSVDFYNSSGDIVGQITTVSGNGESLVLGNDDSWQVDASPYGGVRLFTPEELKAAYALFRTFHKPESQLKLLGAQVDMDYEDDDDLPTLFIDAYQVDAHKGLNYNHVANYYSRSSAGETYGEYGYYDSQGEYQTIQTISEYAKGRIIIAAGGSLPTGITDGRINATIHKEAKAILEPVRNIYSGVWTTKIRLEADECTFNDNAIVTTDDSRLSDARTPLAHTHTKSEVTDFAHTHQVSDIIHPYLAGEIKMYAGATVPSGWLLCDGSSFSSEDYPNLAAALGDAWGTHSGTTYYLPNLNGRTPVGYDANDTYFDTVGETGGNKGMFAHTHNSKSLVGQVQNFACQSSGQGLYGTGIFSVSATGVCKAGSSTNGPNDTITIDATHEHDSVGDTSNNNADIANMPPYAVVKYIICAY